MYISGDGIQLSQHRANVWDLFVSDWNGFDSHVTVGKQSAFLLDKNNVSGIAWTAFQLNHES